VKNRCQALCFQNATLYRYAADARVTITGTVEPVAEGDATKAAREAYLAKHPDAFWVDFGDFSWHRMDGILVGLYKLTPVDTS
jgi:hypothetical protein